MEEKEPAAFDGVRRTGGFFALAPELMLLVHLRSKQLWHSTSVTVELISLKDAVCHHVISRSRQTIIKTLQLRPADLW
jgi:hypothetical protein